MRPLVIFCLGALLVPAAAAALDCTPFQTFDCVNNGYYDYMNGQPGEVVCGVDYTGWTLHVIDLDITDPGFYGFSGVSAASSFNIVNTALILMDDCGAGTCLDSVQSSGMAQMTMCLDAGVHKIVVASNTTAATAVLNVGLSCFTCQDAIDYGYECVYCGSVATEQGDWGTIKSRFR